MLFETPLALAPTPLVTSVAEVVYDASVCPLGGVGMYLGDVLINGSPERRNAGDRPTPGIAPGVLTCTAEPDVNEAVSRDWDDPVLPGVPARGEREPAPAVAAAAPGDLRDMASPGCWVVPGDTRRVVALSPPSTLPSASESSGDRGVER